MTNERPAGGRLSNDRRFLAPASLPLLRAATVVVTLCIYSWYHTALLHVLLLLHPAFKLSRTAPRTLLAGMFFSIDWTGRTKEQSPVIRLLVLSGDRISVGRRFGRDFERSLSLYTQVLLTAAQPQKRKWDHRIPWQCSFIRRGPLLLSHITPIEGDKKSGIIPRVPKR